MSVAPSPDRRYTYRDYKTWPDSERWELINGVAYAMTPAPNPKHQRIIISLARQIDAYLVGKPCEPFTAPVDVFLTKDYETSEDTSTIVQPDLFVVCDPTKVTSKGISGAPDFIIEVLSPSTATHDQITKAALYEAHGVGEYWVLDPEVRLITIRTLSEKGTYDHIRIVKAEEKLSPAKFQDFYFDLDVAFARIEAAEEK